MKPEAQVGKCQNDLYLVGQSFFINSTSVGEWNQNNSTNNPPAITGGDLVFRNSQRIFETEGDHSVFHKPEIVVKGNKEVKDHLDKRTKFWLKFKSPKGYHREILVAADENTTDGFDLGYDAPMIEYNIEDMFWLIGATELVIQGVPDFDKARVIPMGLVIDGTEDFTIEIAKSVNVPEGMEIFLKDKATDSIHDLRKTDYVSTSEPGYINERFEIVFFKEDPKIEPKPEVPGEEVDYGIDLSFRHAHVGRELQILNPKQVPINELLLFDMNGKLITTYKNIAHEKEVRLLSEELQCRCLYS
ncbi:hypothetical protein LZ575_20775 [Antarcticibacterium sp. 1MA-6-2]|uniref:hypothetical protein n=1 Tax=Antarcticibacterium sp. 1MA-6-2 TaxID=2908210 RepID=UPI001F469D1E|nr:hypothetical protein [Antarcticibacterium sp. 1MA-6-2]UJH91065.1 hypothetical protein LZ575_20775 [Antarcticibacterium sp. 1MA-6-2]